MRSRRGIYNIINWLPVFLLGALASIHCTPPLHTAAPPVPHFLQKQGIWADSVLKQMTLEEKIGQLFMVAAYSNRDEEHFNELSTLITEHHIGGLIFFQGGPERQAKMTNELQALADVPLWIGMDAEWGLGMRLDSTISYPRQMSLGAIQDPSLVYEFGSEMARQLKRLQVHVSFSPVVDVNVNPKNPVIGNRSFGESKSRVAEMGIAYMRGLQDNGVMANAKHFPGHGDTENDSHHTLPGIYHDYTRLDSLELYPFKELINEGVGSVMIAHLYIPSLDSTENRASTLSPKIVNSLLRDSLGFRGLAFTDALNMKGVSSYFKPGELDLEALKAGNDVLLFPEDVPAAVSSILQAVESGELKESDINKHCLKVLRAKEWLKLPEQKPIVVEGLYDDLNNNRAKAVQKKLIEASLTVVKNKKNHLPFTDQGEESIAVLNIGDSGKSFNASFGRYMTASYFKLGHNSSFAGVQKIISELSDYDKVIINVYGTSQRPSRKFGLTENTSKIIRDIAAKTDVTTIVYASAYSLKFLDGLKASKAVMVAYQNDDVTQETVAEALVGAGKANGSLPVSANNDFKEGIGAALNKKLRIRPSYPEFTGARSEDLKAIDSIALEGIANQAYPGCQVMVIKSGEVIYQKNFGHFTYEEKIPVTDSSIYDLASITKIVASTASMMKLQDEGQIEITHSLCDYMDICDTSAYFQVNLMEMMSHTARLRAWIPFYLATIEKGQLNRSIYSTTPIDGYCTQVADDLYICDTYGDTLMNEILATSLRSKREYKYSDLGYYFIQKIIERKTGLQLEEYVDSSFYKPLGLKTMGYLPLRNHSKESIVPTEYDLSFRKQLIQGYVHDPGAAMIGGVGGHAGIFSNATDLAVMMQMFLNGGTYGGKRFMDRETIDYFTECHFCEEDNRRGIGFDKPSTKLDSGPTCNSASSRSFGHSGFTGTLAWADPDHEIVYVFLSNRVYPDANNRKLLDMDIRTRIQQVIYDAYSIPARRETANGSLSDRK